MALFISRALLAAVAALGLTASVSAQISRPFNFEYTGGVASNQAVFVVGDIPELGNNDVRYGVKLEPTLAPRWRIQVGLPPGITFNYRYVLRDTGQGRLGDVTNSVALGPVRTATTPDELTEANTKLVFARLRTSTAKLNFRPTKAPTAPFQSLTMTRYAPGRSADESTFVALGASAPDEQLDFYFSDETSQFRDPASGNYTTSLRAVYVQDQRLFTYEPAGGAAGQTSLDPTNRPFEIYEIVRGSEASGYPTLDRSGCPYRTPALFSEHAFGLFPGAGPHIIMTAPDGKEGYMRRHLDQVAVDLAFRIPDVNYDGLIVIDYEAWWPYWTDHPNIPSTQPADAQDGDQPEDWRDYIRTYQPNLIAGMPPAQQEDVFRTTWLATTREFWERTFLKVKELRPNAKVAYYDVPNREYWTWRDPIAATRRRAVNDNELGWLLNLQDVIVGGGYTFYYAIPEGQLAGPYQDNEVTGCIAYYNNLIDECQRVSHGKPIYLFIQPAYHSSNGIYGYQMLNDFNMRAMIEVAYQRAINGVIIWGWMRDQADAMLWTNYYHNTFTPYMRTVFQRPRVVAGVTCPVGNLTGELSGPSNARRDYNPANPPTIMSSVYGGPRKYRVVLPRGYGEHTERQYPVVFFQDGQDIFDGTGSSAWNALPELLASMENAESREAILVGVDASPNRLNEYTPPESGGAANLYSRFLSEELLPLIKSRYRTLPGEESVGVLGAAEGGQTALYLGWSNPAVFSRVGAISGAWRTYSLGFYNRVITEAPRALRVYLDSGDTSAESDRYNLTLSLRDSLASKPALPLVTDNDLKWVVGFGQSQDAAGWRSRLPGAFQFLYPASEDNYVLFELFNKRLNIDNSGALAIEDLIEQYRSPRDLDLNGTATGDDTRLLERALRARESREMSRLER